MTDGLELNPFIYGDPVPPAELIDRDEEVERLLRLAEGGHNTRVQAPRRYGKTSVLLKVIDEAERAGYRTVLVDFLLATTADEVGRRMREAYEQALQGSLRQLLTRMGRSWRGRAKLAPGGVGGELEFSPDTDATQRLSDLLDLPQRILETSGERTLVVFDEFQDFLTATGNLDGLLRSKIQLHGDAASYVFSGSEQSLLEEMFGNRERPLFDQARPMYLEPLADVDLADYIGEKFGETDRDAGEALDLLLELVRGHPQRAMLMAHHLWEQTERGSAADGLTFDRALAQVDRETKERFDYTWQSLAGSPNQRRVLLALARSDETLYNQRTLRAFGLTKSQAQSGEDGLMRSGEVQRIDGRPRIVDPLLERWLFLQGALGSR